MLTSGTVTANIPASDIARAREFYADKLGLTPMAELPGGMLVYGTQGGSTFSVYQTDYAGTAGHTLAQWHVDDLEDEVRTLRDRGVVFEQYDLPDVEWADGIATMPGMGRAAWFKDSEGNILCLDEGMPQG